jgi:hypothetical protein
MREHFLKNFTQRFTMSETQQAILDLLDRHGFKPNMTLINQLFPSESEAKETIPVTVEEDTSEKDCGHPSCQLLKDIPSLTYIPIGERFPIGGYKELEAWLEDWHFSAKRDLLNKIGPPSNIENYDLSTFVKDAQLTGTLLTSPQSTILLEQLANGLEAVQSAPTAETRKKAMHQIHTAFFAIYGVVLAEASLSTIDYLEAKIVSLQEKLAMVV